MIDLISSYLNGNTVNFFNLVGSLESASDVSKTSDERLVKQWYDFWTPLEIRRAVEGNKVNQEKAIKELKAMKEFLLNNKEE